MNTLQKDMEHGKSSLEGKIGSLVSFKKEEN